MSNKSIVEKYMEGFRKTDHRKILSCLTDDVIWEIPGFSVHFGKNEFDKEIENPNANGHPEITINRMIEEGEFVVAEGSVKAKLNDGTTLNLLFCDVFQFENRLIKKLTSYLTFKK